MLRNDSTEPQERPRGLRTGSCALLACLLVSYWTLALRGGPRSRSLRAAHLSGDCTFGRALTRGNVHPFNFSAAGARCVRRRAQLSVAMHPGCPDEETARLAVERAWESCFADRAPFEPHPRAKMDM